MILPKSCRLLYQMSCDIQHTINQEIQSLKKFQVKHKQNILSNDDNSKSLNLYQNLLVVDPLYQFMVMKYEKLGKQVSNQALSCKLCSNGNVSEDMLNRIRVETDVCVLTATECQKDAARALNWIGGCKPNGDIYINSMKSTRQFIIGYRAQICKITQTLIHIVDQIKLLEKELQPINHEKKEINYKEEKTLK